MCISESGLTTEFALCARHADDSDNCEALPQAARESNAFDLRFAGP